jgi:type IV pilus assembly protein PilE
MKLAMRSDTSGFTLIELMIVVSLIAIISAFAFPSYIDYLKESRRSDGIVHLTSAANFQERQMTRTGDYTDSVSKLGGNESESGYYDLTVATNVSAAAVPTPGPSGITAIDLSCGQPRCFVMAVTVQSAQLTDTDCAHFVIDQVGRKRSFNSVGTLNDPDICW